MGCNCTRDNNVISSKIKHSRLEERQNQKSNFSNNDIYSTVINSVPKNTNKNNLSIVKTEAKTLLDYFHIKISFYDETKEIYFQNNEGISNNDITVNNENMEYMLLTDLLNKTIFNSNEYDSNFICEYDNDNDVFVYKIERIIYRPKVYSSSKGSISYKKLKDDSKNRHIGIWKIYINNIEESFCDICNNGRVVVHGDLIELKEILEI
jgi:hypothetical protein